jgi:hypothetical protein
MPEHDNLEFLKLPRPDAQGNQLEEPTKQHVAQPTKPPVARLSPNIRHRLCRFRLGGRARRPRFEFVHPSGYTRIQGALKNLGHRVARSTIAAILKQQGIPPSDERPTSWQTFLRAHWGAVVAADFFTTE